MYTLNIHDAATTLSSTIPMKQTPVLFRTPWIVSLLFVTALSCQSSRNATDEGPPEVNLSEGFSYDYLYSPSVKENGTWVALAFDDKGRLYASDQHGALYRMDLGNAPLGQTPGRIQVDSLDLRIGKANGLLWAFDALYVVVNSREGLGGHNSGVYRLTDTNGDDELDNIETLVTMEGAGEHGPHSIMVSPDGEKLFFINGNHTDLPETYAQRHPGKVTELVLRGIFTLRRSELLWFYQEGASWLFPDAWEQYIHPIPENERDDLISAYYQRLTGNDRSEQLRAAKAWSLWEGSTVSLLPSEERMQSFSSEAFALAFARIECHYFYNGGFFERDDQIIANLEKIRHIPAVIVQGRYDAVTPIKTAWEVHRAWPEAQLNIVKDAGHAASEPGIIDALIRATKKFARR